GAPDGAEHEPSRELPRQRRGREFLQRPEEGADQAADLPDASHCCFGRVRLHRDVLQPDSPAWFRWRHVTGRVRKALRAERRLSVYGTLVGPLNARVNALMIAVLNPSLFPLMSVILRPRSQRPGVVPNVDRNAASIGIHARTTRSDADTGFC